MKNVFFGLFFLISFVIHAQDTVSCFTNERILVVNSIGLFNEDFKWSIAGDNFQGDPINILSELTWKDLRGTSFNSGIKWNAWKLFNIENNFSFATITSGTATDIDYNQNNRRDTVFYAPLDSDRGALLAADLTVGYIFFKDHRFALVPKLGYGLHYQYLYLLDHDHNQALKTTYDTRWNGFIFGLDGKIKVTKNFLVEVTTRYHQLKYHSKANWNLIESFEHPVSFTHEANGFCIDMGSRIRYVFTKSWSVFVSGNYSFWDTGKGVDKLYLQDGQVAYTQMNGVQRTSYGFNIGIAKSFTW